MGSVYPSQFTKQVLLLDLTDTHNMIIKRSAVLLPKNTKWNTSLSWKCCEMVKHTLKILRCSCSKIFKVCLAILRHYAWKGYIVQTLKKCLLRKITGKIMAVKPSYVKLNIKRSSNYLQSEAYWSPCVLKKDSIGVSVCFLFPNNSSYFRNIFSLNVWWIINEADFVH